MSQVSTHVLDTAARTAGRRRPGHLGERGRSGGRRAPPTRTAGSPTSARSGWTRRPTGWASTRGRTPGARPSSPRSWWRSSCRATPTTTCRCCSARSPTRPTGGADMGIVLGANQYGKAETRVVRIERDTDRHEIRDLNVSTSLSGDFAAAHLAGDQAHVLPTDTQKNTVFAFAREHGVGEIEEFALRLARHFVDDVAPVTRADVRDRGVRLGADRRPRPRVPPDRAGGPHRRGRRRRGRQPRGQRGAGPGRAEVHRVGVRGLPRRRVHDPARDPRPRAGHLARRRAGPTSTAAPTRAATDWAASYDAVRRALLERFAHVHWLALQQTLWEMGRAVLEARPGASRDRAGRAEHPPLPRRPQPVRAGQPRRGVPRGRPAVRPDRGRSCERGRGGRDGVPPPPHAWPRRSRAKAAHPDAVPIAGGTDVMVELNFDRHRPAALLDLTRVAELGDWERATATGSGSAPVSPTPG